MEPVDIQVSLDSPGIGPKPGEALPAEVFEQIFEGQDEALALLDPEKFRILRVNRKFAELLATPAADLIGHPLGNIFIGMPDYMAQAGSKPSLPIRGRWPGSFQWHLTDRSGKKFWVEAKLQELSWSAGSLILLQIRQIRDQQTITTAPANQQDLFLALFQSLQDIALLLTPEGTVLAANETAARRFQRSVAELLGLNIFDLFPPEVAALRRRKMEEVLRTGKIIQFEDEFAGRVIGSILYPVFDQAGQVACIGVYAFDITAQHQAQEELKRVQKRLDYLLNHTPAAIYSSHCVDLCSFSYLSPNIEPLLGYTAAEILEQPGFWEAHIHPEDLPQYLQVKKTAQADGRPQGLEYRFRHRNGDYLWLHDEFRLVRDAQGQPLEFVGSLLNISERKAAEQDRQQVEYRFRMLAEHSTAGIYVIQADRFLYVNPRMAQIFGYTIEEMLTQIKPLDLVVPEDRDFVAEKIARRLRGEPPEQYTLRALHRHGHTVYCEVRGKNIQYQGEPAILGTLLDITQRVKAEEARRQTEQRFRFLVEKMNDGLGVLNDQAQVTYVNPKMAQMLGYEEGQLLGHSVLEFVAPDHRERLQAQLARRQLGDETPYEIDWLRQDGTRLTTLISPRAMFDAEGNFLGSFGIITDISARLEVEQALQRREQYFRMLTENVSDLIGLLDADGTIHYVNRAAGPLFGYVAEELTGRNIFQLLHNDTARTFRHLIDRLLQEPDQGLMTEVQIRHRDGSWRLWEVKAKNLLGDPIVQGIVINARDITTQKQMERELKEAAAAMQLLTRRILTAQEDERRRLSLELHDDLGQSLTALKLQFRSLANKLRRDQAKLKTEFHQTLQYINEVIEKVRRLAHDLSPSLLDNIGLISALRLLLEDCRRHYQVDDNLQNLPDFENRLTGQAKIHIYRIFQELINNIVKHAQATAIYINLQPEIDRLLITVADNGRGFSEADQTRGVAGGLGLSAIKERVKILGGTITIDGRGRGVKVYISIPWQQNNYH